MKVNCKATKLRYSLSNSFSETKATIICHTSKFGILGMMLALDLKDGASKSPRWISSSITRPLNLLKYSRSQEVPFRSGSLRPVVFPFRPMQKFYFSNQCTCCQPSNLLMTKVDRHIVRNLSVAAYQQARLQFVSILSSSFIPWKNKP